MLSICGVNCNADCRAFGDECIGCNALEGKVSWAVFYERTVCPIYECAFQKGLSSCGECGEAPCKIWYDTHNPDASDDEFEADIKSRLKNLELMNQ